MYISTISLKFPLELSLPRYAPWVAPFVQRTGLKLEEAGNKTTICVFVFVYLYMCICICVIVFVYLHLCACTAPFVQSSNWERPETARNRKQPDLETNLFLSDSTNPDCCTSTNPDCRTQCIRVHEIFARQK